ncbi:hypothetical protein M407DRAFT_9862 [Tulasnella calospora MUT 4182]|uniref:Uncharacterized protein n=1 Tax=Tulasnella calospora MUT 4182 TaxID=1051891 RepID=A0A0C3LMK6_9AGAM|nr:hypothetical protein M407DRAFT_9862 [Tulasnella calospora MUT 4182]
MASLIVVWRGSYDLGSALRSVTEVTNIQLRLVDLDKIRNILWIDQDRVHERHHDSSHGAMAGCWDSGHFDLSVPDCTYALFKEPKPCGELPLQVLRLWDDLKCKVSNIGQGNQGLIAQQPKWLGWWIGLSKLGLCTWRALRGSGATLAPSTVHSLIPQASTTKKKDPNKARSAIYDGSKGILTIFPLVPIM